MRRQAFGPEYVPADPIASGGLPCLLLKISFRLNWQNLNLATIVYFSA